MAQKKSKLIILFFTLTFFSCKQKKYTDYFDKIAKEKGLVGIKTTPIKEADAKKDIEAFFDKVKTNNPDTKCFVEVTKIQELLDRLKDAGASGIRIYSAAYTPTTIAVARTMGMNSVRENDYHLILVPIDDSGKEIKSFQGNSTIIDYNNDCPYSCPANWNNISLIAEADRGKCNN